MSLDVPYQITDKEAFKKAYPKAYTPEVITRDVLNRELAYKIIKLNYEMGEPTPGVVYKNPLPEEEKTEAPQTETNSEAGEQ